MSDLIPSAPAPGGEFLFYQTEDGRTRLQVRVQDETVWLSQAQIAELFQTTQQNISLHLQNIFEEGELTLAATHKEFLSVRREGNRDLDELPQPRSAAVLGCGFAHRPGAWVGNWRRDTALTRRRGRLHYEHG